MDGATYNEHKDGFKAILKRHGIKWKGTRFNVWWGSETEKVVATYDRDEDADVTLGATLCWHGLKGQSSSDCLEELRTWAAEVGAKKGAVASKAAAKVRKDKQSKEQKVWSMVWKPQADALRSQGRPKSWIDRDVEAFEQEKEQRFGEAEAKPKAPKRASRARKA